MSETAQKGWTMAVTQEVKPEMEQYHAHVLAVARAALTGDHIDVGAHSNPAKLVAFAKGVVDEALALPVHEALKTQKLPLSVVEESTASGPS